MHLAMIALLTLTDIGFAAPIQARVMTYNVLCRYCSNGQKLAYDLWDIRVQHLKATVAEVQPDLIGFQELSSQDDLAEFQQVLPHHQAVIFEKALINRYDAVLLFDTRRFKLVTQGGFWLSKYPDRGGWISWHWGSVPRHLTWAMLVDITTGRQFVFANTHFDNNSPNQEKSAEVVNEQFAKLFPGLPTILTGDLNSNPESRAFQKLTQGLLADTFPNDDRVIQNRPEGWSFDFSQAIDHILVGQADFRIHLWSALNVSYTTGTQTMFPSDHVPVVAELDIN